MTLRVEGNAFAFLFCGGLNKKSPPQAQYWDTCSPVTSASETHRSASLGVGSGFKKPGLFPGCSFCFMLVVQDVTLSSLSLPPCSLLAAMSPSHHGPLSLKNYKPKQTPPFMSCLDRGVLSQRQKTAANTPSYLSSTWESACVPVLLRVVYACQPVC